MTFRILTFKLLEQSLTSNATLRSAVPAILENIIADNLDDLRRTDKQRVHSKRGRGRSPIKRRTRRSNTWVESSDERMKGLPPIKSARSEREKSQKRFPSDARCCAQISIQPRIGGTKGISDTPLSLPWGIETEKELLAPFELSFERDFSYLPSLENRALHWIYYTLIEQHNKSMARSQHWLPRRYYP